jgi:glycosyltransferase involved in cell wall biosynthesis
VPSRREGYGVVAREAMAYGRPVVATAVGGLVDAMQDGASGVLVPTRDERALRAAIERLLKDPRLRTRIGSAARAVAAEHFGRETAVRGAIRAYEDVMDRRSYRRPPR